MAERCKHPGVTLLPRMVVQDQQLNAVVVCEDCGEMQDLPLTWFCTSKYTFLRRA